MQTALSSEPLDSPALEWAWEPQIGPQSDAISATWCPELLFGGAKYGGKTDFLLGDFLQDVERYGKHWQGILFRQSYVELQEVILRSETIYGRTKARWVEYKKRWEWPNGAILRFRYLETVKDFYAYNGHSYTWIAGDELGQWHTLEGYHMLKGCLRWAAYPVPTKRIRATANPGGPGHSEVKAYFIDPAPLGYKPIAHAETGIMRMFIPSRVEDNKLGLEADPEYIQRLKMTGSPQLVRAWLEGDWDAITGAYFPEFSRARHVVAPFEVPSRWIRFRAFDWGSAAPFCVLWLAVSDGDPKIGLPTGCLVVYREWYGAESPNKGLKMHAEDVAKGIKDREGGREEKINYSVADPSIFKEEGGPSIGERMKKAGVMFQPADNTRVAGWDQLRSRLDGLNEHSPMIMFFSTCTNLIRTLPTIQHDTKHSEDADTKGEDHAVDTLRYGIMSRPWTRPMPSTVPKKIKTISDLTLDELTQSVRRRVR